MNSLDAQIAKHNIIVNYLSEITGSLIFLIPIWVAYELQYITIAQLPIIEAIIQGTQLLLELPTGALADLWGKKATIVIGYAIQTLGAILYASSRSFDAFVFYAILCGIGNALTSGSREALFYDSLKAAGRESEYAKISSKTSLLFQIGLAVATLTGGFFGSISLIIPVWMSAVMTFLTMIVFLFSREPRIDSTKFTLKNYIMQTKVGFMELFKSKYVRDISLFYIGVGGITWAAMMIFNATLLTEIGYAPYEFGVTVSAIRIFNSLVLFGALHIGKVFTKKTTFLIIPVIMIACYLPGILLTKWIAAFAIAGSIFASTFRWIVLGKYVNDEYASKNRATALSTLSMAVSIMVVSLAIISGPVMEYLGGVKTMFSLMGIFSLVFILPLGIRISLRYGHIK